MRELRELVRYRARLVVLRTGLKAQLKAVLAKHGLRPPVKDLWGVSGPIWFDQHDLPRAYTTRIESIRDLVEVYDREIDMLEREIHRPLTDHAGYQAMQAIPGVGRTIAAIMMPLACPCGHRQARPSGATEGGLPTKTSEQGCDGGVGVRGPWSFIHDVTPPTVPFWPALDRILQPLATGRL